MSGASICVGRAPALAVLHEQLAVAAAGAARTVWIDGEPGVGKTTLVRAFLAETSYRVAWASGDEEETSLPYGVLNTLHRAIAAAADAPRSLGDVPSTHIEPLAAGAELLVALGGLDDPLVLVVDDLQWADAQSASALRFALRRLLAERILVVLITRPNPADSLGEAWARLLLDTERVTRLRLDGLTTEGMVELLVATGHGHLDRPVAERLSEHTKGNPLHARALIDELGDSELRAGGVLPAPRSFAQLTIARLAALDDEAARLTVAGAVLGSRFQIPLAASVGNVGDPVSALDSAMEAGLLERAAAGEAVFPHPLVRAAIYNDIRPIQLRALHEAAAVATEGARSLEHRVAATAGSDDALAAELDRQALEAWLSGKGSTAYDLFMAAALLSSNPSAHDRRLLFAVEALFSSGDFARAFGMRETVLGCSESAHRSYVLGLIGHGPAAEAHFSAAVAGAEETDVPLLRLRAIGGRAMVQLRLGRPEAALEDANTVIAAAGTEIWGSGLMLWVQVVSLANLGRTAEAWDLLEERRQAEQYGVELDGLCARGLLEVVDDNLPAAVRDLTALAERARAGETCRLLELGLSLLATAQYRLGQWDEAAMHSELAATLYSDAHRVPVAHAVAAFVHAGRGRFDLAEDDVRAAEEAAQAVPTEGNRFYVAVARAVVAQARGQLDQVRAVTAPLLDGRLVPTVEGQDPWGWRVLAIEGLIGTGELAEARDRLSAFAELVTTQGWCSPQTDMARLEGELAEQSGDIDAALAAYSAGLQWDHERAPLPLPMARLALAYGSLLRRTGARRQAIEQLRNAHAVLASLGASPLLATCDAELSACGLPATTADISGRLGLTFAEQTVAHLVAQGLTNREAATRLYVSPKTVDYHLGNIYAKLGIRSRRDLAGRLSPGA